MFLPLPLFLYFTFITTVAGHGFVHDVVIDGQDYPGWNPFVDPYASPVPARIVRKIPSDGPIVSVDDPNIVCNQGGAAGTSLLAAASGGSQVLFEWDYWPADHLGPVSTYMASCNGDCTTFNATSTKWFKLDAGGYENGQWASAKLIAGNNSWTSKIPETILPGQYLLRHEIVALHSIGKPQFYPSCSQVNISGTGTGKPDSQSLVLIPGVYDNVQWPDIYSNFGSFTIPGPPVVTLVGSGESTSSTSTSPTSTTFTQTATPISYSMPTDNSISTAATSQPSGQCSLSSARRLSRRRLSVRRSFQNDS